MLPQHFNPTLGGQQGMPQQQVPPQAQVDHHQQGVPGVLGDPTRAWQMNQLQQFRQQGVGDMGGGPSNVSISWPLYVTSYVAFQVHLHRPRLE
ncbi:uncharacterized protein PHACADRAFT_251689 [Phanerochaete carnosa HHB-10118-sp]|uniref:Uncharacterized protein n=1 Tax=Phanerochaete carnosa (strain HHB-10118-sp) TaxID=650164 RepID=K5X4T7_PHACS|nr:uncharacterized protein PHACADRAFT_251689 [Phanerochaete carnosa HHB-10118-sp]EKM57822.1 hypothetical protein PHACADRAFT_251689 [Phanerochaete carnosa HHB-10118-sp]